MEGTHITLGALCMGCQSSPWTFVQASQPNSLCVASIYNKLQEVSGATFPFPLQGERVPARGQVLGSVQPHASTCCCYWSTRRWHIGEGLLPAAAILEAVADLRKEAAYPSSMDLPF